MISLALDYMANIAVIETVTKNSYVWLFCIVIFIIMTLNNKSDNSKNADDWGWWENSKVASILINFLFVILSFAAHRGVFLYEYRHVLDTIIRFFSAD